MGRVAPSPAGLRVGAGIAMNYVHEGARVRAYCGSVGCGKTRRLVEACAGVVRSGVQAEDILVFAAGPSAAQALAARLAAACPEAARVRVTTPLAWALELLGGDAARAFTGREAHVLNSYEQDFLFEDMRPCGMQQRRLREMLKFFYRGFSEMRDDEPGWLETVEEKQTMALAKANLSMLRAYHPCEVTPACVRYLVSHPSALGQARVAHVLVDDFRALSRASQRACELLAGETLDVAWDPVASLVGEEPYGYAEGLDELVADDGTSFERVDLKAFEGSACAHTAVANLFKQDCVEGEAPAAPAGRAEAVTDSQPDVCVVGMLGEEAASVVGAVREALEGGCAPEDVFVIAGKPSWAGRTQAALAEAGIPVSRLNVAAHLRGDIRDPEKCADMAMANAVRLVAEPRSCLAWRCWCGFGDYLCHSAAFTDLARALEGHDATLCDLLFGLVGANDIVVEGDMLDREKVATRVREGHALIAEAQGLTGEALIAVLRRHVCPQGQQTGDFDALVSGAAPDLSAAELLAHIDAALASGAPEPECVRVGACDDLIGQSPRVLVLCGLTNGLYPEKGYFDLTERTIDDQAKMHDRLIHQLIEVCGKAGERLVLSGFSCADILDAEPMKLATERIRLRNRRRVCEFGPSVAVDYATGAKTAYVR